MSARIKQFFFPYLWITVASALYALGFCWCYDPNQIGFGGITGVGQILNHFFPILPIGTVVILLNIPLFLLGWRLLGGHLRRTPRHTRRPGRGLARSSGRRAGASGNHTPPGS